MDGVKTLEEFPTIAHKVKNDILSYLWKIDRSFFFFFVQSYSDRKQCWNVCLKDKWNS